MILLLWHNGDFEWLSPLTEHWLFSFQISINGIALNSTAEGRAELEQIFISIRETLLLDSIEAKLRPYLLFLCDIQAANYKPLAENLMKFYSKYLDSCQRYKPSDIDVKLYGTKWTTVNQCNISVHMFYFLSYEILADLKARWPIWSFWFVIYELYTRNMLRYAWNLNPLLLTQC